MTSLNIMRVAPNAESLSEVKVKVKCPVSECNKTMRHKGSLMIHMKAVHNIKMESKYHKPSVGEKVQFHCPVNVCAYHRDANSQHFTSLQGLKQHYLKVHAEKKFKCSHCDRGFAIESAQKRHQETCGTIYRCSTCSCTYTSSEALLTHCKRHQHKPASIDTSSNKGNLVGPNSTQTIVSSSNPGNNTNVYFIVLPMAPQQHVPETRCGQVPILPKPNSKGIRHNNVVMPTPATIASSEQIHSQHALLMTTAQHDYASVDSSSLSTLAEMAIASETGQFKPLVIGSETSQMDSLAIASDTGHIEPYNPSVVSSQRIIDQRQPLVGATSYPYSGITTQSLVTTTSFLNSGIASQPLVSTTCYQNPGITSENIFSTTSYQDSGITSPSFLYNCMTGSSNYMQTSQILSAIPKTSIVTGASTQTTDHSVGIKDFLVPTSHKSNRWTKTKQSRSSQVSPRIKNNGPLFGNTITMQSCETQTTTQINSGGQNDEQQRAPRRRLIDVSSQSSQTLAASTNITHKHPRHKRRKLQFESKNVCTNTVGLQSSNIGIYTSGSDLGKVLNLQSVFPGTVAEQSDLQSLINEFAGLSDSETQTIAVLEELTSSLASTTSTQTSKSFLAQPQSIGVGTDPEYACDTESQTNILSQPRTVNSSLLDARLGLTEQTSADNFSHALDFIDNLAWEEDISNPLVCPSPQVEHLVSNTSQDINSHTAGVSYDEVRHTTGQVSSETLCQSVDNHSLVDFVQTTSFPMTSIRDSSDTGFNHASTEISPETDLDLFDFLDAGIQADSGPGTTTHTQTVDDIWELFGQNMETQTGDDLFFSDLGFSDIHTQTNVNFLECGINQQSTETQTSLHTASSALFGDNAEKSDIETQTMFPLFNFDYSCLIDTHTQTNL